MILTSSADDHLRAAIFNKVSFKKTYLPIFCMEQ